MDAGCPPAPDSRACHEFVRPHAGACHEATPTNRPASMSGRGSALPLQDRRAPARRGPGGRMQRSAILPASATDALNASRGCNCREGLFRASQHPPSLPDRDHCPAPRPAGADPHPRRPPEQPQEPRPRHPHRTAGRRHRHLGQRQVLAGLRHPLCRRAAPLRRDLLGLCPPVPRPDGPTAGRQHRRRAAGHRHRPDQSGAHLALDGRHDDRAQRPSEAADGARRHPVLPAVRRAGAHRRRGQHRRRHPRACRRPRRPAPGRQLPGAGAGRLRRAAGHRRAVGPGLHPHPPARGAADAGCPRQRQEGPQQGHRHFGRQHAQPGAAR